MLPCNPRALPSSMTKRVDVAIVGAGPAGMAAGRSAANAGASTVVLDNQGAPGGQIWRGVEDVAARNDLRLFGPDYAKGIQAVRAFRSALLDYRPNSNVIGIEPNGNGCDILYVQDGAAQRLSTRRLIVATGTYERPIPFPGWTLPGVMTLGAAQIALKTANLAPQAPFVLAGQGPLLLLLEAQLRAAGIRPEVTLDLSDPRQRLSALLRAPSAALFGTDYLAKGVKWLAGRGRVIGNVIELSAEGDTSLRRVLWRSGNGEVGTIEASMLLVHDGVVPNAQLTRAMRAPHEYDPTAHAWRPSVDKQTGRLLEHNWAYVAGDCASVNGWQAAEAMGALTGLAAAGMNGGLFAKIRLRRAKVVRPFLEALYPPAPAFSSPLDETIVCRCDEVSAGDIRQAANLGAQGPNQLKAFTRAGMGPCQGRMCAQVVTAVLAAAQDRTPADVGLMRVRMPITPVSIGELSQLNETPMELPRS
jgi:NADPH-dependent 2,4-dienoyl-CoA reductase/sulfur reductase-like enzyme